MTVCWLCTIYGGAQDFGRITDSFLEDDTAYPWIVEADELRYDDQLKQYIAKGNVSIRKGEKQLTAEYIRFDHQALVAYASGNVRVSLGNDVLTASQVEMDLQQQTGTMHDGTLFLSENNFFITGAKIEKLKDNVYVVEKASVTTCKGDSPDWMITGKYLKVTVEGYGHMRNATFRAKKTPVMFTPYLLFPAKQQRQSGLLVPEFGSSSRWGFYVTQPLFWAINDSMDATFYGQYLEKRGFKVGTELRYAITETSKGTWMFDFLNDRKIDDGTGDSSENWGYTDDDVLRPNRDRYWFRMSHYNDLPLGLFAKLDMDVVSDQDYLTEFRPGYMGFYETENYYRRNFDRQLDPYDDSVRLNRFNLNRIWEQYSFDLDLRYFDDVVNRRFGDTDTTLQRLPLILFDAAKQPVLSSPVLFDFESSYNYFYRQDGDRGHRLDLHPRLYYPLRLKNYVTIEPSFGLRETAWILDSSATGSGTSQNNTIENRFLYDLRVDLTSELSKVYGTRRFGFDRIKHLIKPQVSYDYIPELNQDDLPNFDVLDRIEAKNEFTYSITNYLVSRKPHQKDKHAGQTTAALYDYRQINRFKLEQSYDIDEARRNNLAAGEKREPFSPITGELDVFLTPHVVFASDATWDVYRNRFEDGNAAVRVVTPRKDKFNLEYHYTRQETESIYAEVVLQITSSLAAGAEYEYNILDDRRLKTGLLLSYNAQCWATELKYTDEPSEQRVEIRFNLTGLSDFGYEFAGLGLPF